MEREFKSLPFTNLKAESSGRIRAGIAAVFGNVDAVGDRVMPGAFSKTISEGAKRCKHLWNHSYQHPPIASIKELRELSRNELPAEVLEKSPEATGGLLVKREYYDADLANWILQAIDAGDINEMSFAYDTVKSASVTENDTEIRELLELKLFDTSDVLWGCNFATVAAGAKNVDVMPLGVIASQLSMLESQVKAGRRNASSDQKLINLIHDTAASLGAVCNPDADSDETESGKAEAAKDSTSLSSDWLKSRNLDLANLFN
jgi:HK97 family phage prohead protease